MTNINMRNNPAEVGMRCIKYMLLTITLMFVLTSALIISVGTTVYAIYYDFDFLIDARHYSTASVLIVIGVIMLFVSLFGCIGALKESTCLVNIFALLLSLVFIMEISAAIAAYKLQHSGHAIVTHSMEYAIEVYPEDREIQDAVDFVQSRLSCCGVDSYNSWLTADLSHLNQTVTVLNITVPESCCAAYEYTIESETTAVCTEIYVSGCLNRAIFLVSQSALLLGTGAMTIAFIQIIGIAFSIMLAKAIRRAKSERERRRWEIREQMINSYSYLSPGAEKMNQTDQAQPVIYVPAVGHTNA